VGQVHGGTIFNGIPQELSFTMDLRSPDPKLLDSLDHAIEGMVAAVDLTHVVDGTLRQRRWVERVDMCDRIAQRLHRGRLPP
jgi:acetylornithine deacetylase/succinyl-diaminopimelate desuccinylase-like protein